MDPNKAAADWLARAQAQMGQKQQFVASSQPYSTTAMNLAAVQPVRGTSATVHINANKLKAQTPFFKCPDWAAQPRQGMYLDVCKGTDVLDRLTIDAEPYYLFGRQENVVDFKLEHPSVSRVHFALVHHQNGSVFVIDLGSGHGSAINNRRIDKNKPTKLDVGSTLQAGASTRTYVLRHDRSEGGSHIQPAQAQPRPGLDSDRKRPREEERPTHNKDDGVLAGWNDFPVKKALKRKQPEEIRCSHILLKHRDMKRPFDRHDNVITRTKDEAIRILKAHKEEIILNLDGMGPQAKMRKIVKKESDCVSSWKKGGDLGRIKKGQMPKDFEDVAFNLEIGEVGGPVDSELGVHLIMRTELTSV
uniref:peptidylprolyl isomerase n=1 Tax=Eutreptiella gymnastica TaxID=73025 RepID=A0A7S1IET3_9EUGL|mmetsp:Transcript_151848/g.265285  ORF Transcript_151848/g.265285 Transcript_151848/m.265285 type:complete len:360 (+) Transcript_151848:37-1116(+)